MFRSSCSSPSKMASECLHFVLVSVTLLFSTVVSANVSTVVSNTTESPKSVPVLGNDDSRIAAAVCQLDCLERYGVRHVWPYDVDPRGIYIPSMSCPEEASGVNIAAIRFNRCQKCTQECLTEEIPLNGIPRHLDVDHKLKLKKPALHCRTWAPVTSDSDELASIDPEHALAPMVYLKVDVDGSLNDSGVNYSGNSIMNRITRSSKVDGRPPVAFLLDLRKLLLESEKEKTWSEWFRVGVSTSAVTPINELEAGHTYQWRVAAITVNRTIMPWVTSDPINASMGDAIAEYNTKPGSVTNARIHRWVRTDDINNKLNAIVAWDPNPEYSCSYEVYFEFEGSSRMRNWRSDVSTLNLAILDHMEFSSKYTFRIRAKNPLANAESDVHIMEAFSPSCLEVYDNSFKFCPPPAPTDVTLFWDGDVLRVQWNLTDIATPDNPIDTVTVHLVEEFFPIERDTYLAAYRSYRSPRYGATPKIVLPGNATSAYFEGLPKTSAYKAWVRAETPGGSNDSAHANLLPALSPPSHNSDLSEGMHDPAVDQALARSRSSSTWLAPLAFTIIVVIAVFGVVYMTKCRKNRSCFPIPSSGTRNVKPAGTKTSNASFSRVSTHDVDVPDNANRLNNSRHVERSCDASRTTFITTSNEYSDALNKAKGLKKWFSFRKQKSVVLESASSGVSTMCVSPRTDVGDATGGYSGYLRPVNGTQTSRFQNLRFFGERVILTSAMSLSPPDDYEVSWEQVILQEVLGEGAFGVVRKAQLKLTNENRAKLIQKNAPLKCVKKGSKREGVVFETVAIKMLKDGAGLEEYQQLKNEMEVLKMIHHHPNVVGIVAAITQARPMALVVQHCPYGDLHTQLRKLAEEMEHEKSLQKEREKVASAENNGGIVYAVFDKCLSMDDLASQGSAGSIENDVDGSPAGPSVHNEMYGGNDADSDASSAGTRNSQRLSGTSSGSSGLSAATMRIGFPVPQNRPMAPPPPTQNRDSGDSSNKLSVSSEDGMRTPADLLSIARQIASGMEYLAKNKVVHRDLAARNILLYEPKHVKISDFGLSRDVYARNLYERTSNGKVPIRWMAPESILHQIYTTKSDVWSFGILLWEIATLGGVPYPGISPGNLFTLLQQGYIMPKPNNCSNDLYSLMVTCWQLAAADRPTFTELKQRLDKMLEDSTSEQYLTLNADPVPREETD